MFSERVLACSLAIILLWITSLRVSVSIASHYLGLVSVQTIASTVSKNARLVDNERKKYASCVDRELRECSRGLEGDIAEESDRVKMMKERNRAHVHDIEIRLEGCMTLRGQIRNMLLEWIDASVVNTIVFNRNITCFQELLLIL